MVDAQIVNGDFEDGFDGWSIPACQEAVIHFNFIPDASPNCLGLGAFVDWDCRMDSPVHQFLPWLTPGPWLLSGWIKGATPGNIFGAYVGISTTSGYGDVIAELSSFTDQWIFQQNAFEVAEETDLDSLRIEFLQDGSAIPYTYFDELKIEPAGSTSFAEGWDRQFSSRPNPATDKLWIDLPETAISILAVDASGRTHDLKDFTHRDRTLEVDVHALPVGICLLRITTAAGTHAVRFVKA